MFNSNYITVMKKIYFFLLLAAVFTACNNDVLDDLDDAVGYDTEETAMILVDGDVFGENWKRYWEDKDESHNYYGWSTDTTFFTNRATGRCVYVRNTQFTILTPKDDAPQEQKEIGVIYNFWVYHNSDFDRVCNALTNAGIVFDYYRSQIWTNRYYIKPRDYDVRHVNAHHYGNVVYGTPTPMPITPFPVPYPYPSN